MSLIDIPTIKLDESRDHHVIQELYKVKQESPKELRTREFTIQNDQVWTSWIMRETVYRKKAETFPTMARGIFTTMSSNEKYKVMVRGYDKFHNILETKYTQWPALTQDTQGPYEVTSKENGCIIFIVALDEENIVVTSKHAIPNIKTDSTVHGGVGYNWVIKHLASVEKSEKDLAKWLFDKNVTLVAELCDDEFQQHILPYTDKDRGLYLHGINYNSVDLITLPSSTVQQVAIEFGFHKTEYDTFDTIEEIRAFGEKMQQTGCYKGKEVEGAVIRCKRNGKDFMFKIKNEQYLVYRDYREVTNAVLICDKDTVSLDLNKQVKFKYEKTRLYFDWLKKQVVDKPELFKQYKHQKGIIEVRQEFEMFWQQSELNA